MNKDITHFPAGNYVCLHSTQYFPIHSSTSFSSWCLNWGGVR